VLLPLAPIAAPNEAELVAQLRPGIDGLVIDDGLRRATFLPAVWNALPDPGAFLHALRRKAGMPAGVWPATLRAWRYEVEEMVRRRALRIRGGAARPSSAAGRAGTSVRQGRSARPTQVARRPCVDRPSSRWHEFMEPRGRSSPCRRHWLSRRASNAA
jgi:hypothetical protein